MNIVRDQIKRSIGVQNRDLQILDYLALKTWTPHMGALLVSGIAAPKNCTKFPAHGVGLDNQSLHGSNERFHVARKIYEDWLDSMDERDNPPNSLSPFDFLSWCDEEYSHHRAKREWLDLLLHLMGCTPQGYLDAKPSPESLHGTYLPQNGGSGHTPPVHTKNSMIDLPVSATVTTNGDLLTGAINAAIALAGTTQTAAVFLHLRDIAERKTPPFTGLVKGPALEYKDDFNKSAFHTKERLRSRLQRMRAKEAKGK